MKRLLLPLLAALSSPNPVSAGDLGVADFDIQKRYNRKRLNNLAIKNAI